MLNKILKEMLRICHSNKILIKKEMAKKLYLIKMKE